MNMRIVFDKETLDKRLRTGWGVSFLIDGKILFDTGENGRWLLDNMKKLNVDITKLKAVIISHDHWDHTGGLGELLNKKENLNVFACPDFSAEFKRRVRALKGNIVENAKPAQILKDIYVTGQIPGEYAGQFMPEQALLAKTNRGISVITGCAHPGIIDILEKVRESFPGESIYSVLGGFHLMDKERQDVELIIDRFKEMGVKKAGPTHCTGMEAEKVFESRYEENFISVKVGDIIRL